MRRLGIGSVWSERGFGLVEALVIVAVLGLLAAILVPVLRQREATAHTAGARALAQEIQLGMERYAADRGEYPPPGTLAAVLERYARLGGAPVTVAQYGLVGDLYRLEVVVGGTVRFAITPSTIVLQQ